VQHNDKVQIQSKTFDVKNQLLICSQTEQAFSEQGDSGAVIINEDHKVVGLLWGRNGNGESLACSIVPVMAMLHLESLSSDPANNFKS
jgi:hypothetical protein